MRRVMLSTLVLAGAVLLGSCATNPFLPVAGPIGPGRTSITVHGKTGGHYFYAPVNLNGEDAGYFLLDTGAGSNYVYRAAADRLRLPKAERVTIRGPKAIDATPREVSRLSVGDMVFLAHLVAVWNGAGTSEKDSGILGYPILRVYPFTLDYRSSTITFHERARFKPPAGAIPLPLKFIADRPYLKCRINDKSDQWLLLDTGAQSTLTLSKAFWPKHPELAPSAAVAISRSYTTADGDERVFPKRVASVEVFGHRFDNVPASLVAEAGRDDDPPEMAGIVGGGILHQFRLTFDYRHETVWAEWNPEESVSELVSRGVDLDAKDFAGWTPLHRAIETGQTERAKAFIRAGVNVNPRTPGSSYLIDALAHGDLQVARMLIEAGADVNARRGASTTPLMAALFDGRAEVAQMLIARGADVKVQNDANQTTLIAEAFGGAGLTEALIAAGVDINAKDKEGRTALFYAAAFGRKAMIEVLLSAGADVKATDAEGDTPLMAAGAKGTAEVVDMLIAAGADVNAVQKEGGSALTAASLAGKANVVRLLLDRGADVNAATKGGITALMNAAAAGHVEVVEILLNAGADVRARDSKGQTALDYAREYKRQEVVRLLRKHQAKQ